MTTLARPAAVESKKVQMMVEMEIETPSHGLRETPPQLSGERLLPRPCPSVKGAKRGDSVVRN